MKTSSTKSIAFLIIDKNKNVVVVEEFGRYWGIPRGRQSVNETNEQTARREAFEETNIKRLKFLGEIGNYSRYTFDENGQENGKELKNITVLAFEFIEGDLKSNDPDITDVKWIRPQEAIKLMINDKDRQFFEQCIEYIEQI